MPSKVAREWAEKIDNHFGDSSPENLSHLYDEWADNYEEIMMKDWEYKAPDQCAKLFKQYRQLTDNNKPYKILDVGCGIGLAAQSINKLLPNSNLEITGIDISAKSLQVASRKNIYSRLIKLDITKFPYSFCKANEFDCILCCGVMTYIRDKDVTYDLFKEWIRISKPNAILIVTQWSQWMKTDEPIYYDYKQIKWGCLQHLRNQTYLPSNPNYKEKNVLSDYFVAQNLKQIRSKL